MLEFLAGNSLGQLTAAIYATIAGVLVGAIIKFFNVISETDRTELETHLVLRKELREELDTVKEEIRILKIELDEWKQKYYNQVELTTELRLAVFKLTSQVEESKRINQELLDKYCPNG